MGLQGAILKANYGRAPFLKKKEVDGRRIGFRKKIYIYI